MPDFKINKSDELVIGIKKPDDSGETKTRKRRGLIRNKKSGGYYPRRDMRGIRFYDLGQVRNGSGEWITPNWNINVNQPELTILLLQDLLNYPSTNWNSKYRQIIKGSLANNYKMSVNLNGQGFEPLTDDNPNWTSGGLQTNIQTINSIEIINKTEEDDSHRFYESDISSANVFPHINSAGLHITNIPNSEGPSIDLAIQGSVPFDIFINPAIFQCNWATAEVITYDSGVVQTAPMPTSHYWVFGGPAACATGTQHPASTQSSGQRQFWESDKFTSARPTIWDRSFILNQATEYSDLNDARENLILALNELDLAESTHYFRDFATGGPSAILRTDGGSTLFMNLCPDGNPSYPPPPFGNHNITTSSPGNLASFLSIIRQNDATNPYFVAGHLLAVIKQNSLIFYLWMT